jgi:DNA mismatch repair protein MLH3
MSIQPLPAEAVAQIKSSIVITSLNGVISELVKNSFDAGSTKIDISVDYSRGGCVIEDNGVGILPSEFEETGGLGKLHRNQFLTKFISRHANP